MGSTFVHRLADSTGTTPADVVRGYMVARAVFDLDATWTGIDALDNIVADAVQTAMQVRLIRFMLRATLWFLRRGLTGVRADTAIPHFTAAVSQVTGMLDSGLGAADGRRFADETRRYVEAGVPDGLARRVAGGYALYTALDACDVAQETGRPVAAVAGTYFRLADRFDAAWLWDSIGRLPSATHWQAQARAALRDELEERLRSLSRAVLVRSPEADDPERLMSAWEAEHASGLARVRQILGELQAAKNPDLAMLSVGLRALRHLA
jgi:glutamate dehydrogenase